MAHGTAFRTLQPHRSQSRYDPVLSRSGLCQPELTPSAGLWQFELNNEAVTGKTSQIHEQLKSEAAKALHDALTPALHLPVPAAAADKTAVDAVAYQEARAAAIGATVALGLAGDGRELQRIAELAPALAPADDSLLDILQHITTMPPGPGFDALMQLLESRDQVHLLLFLLMGTLLILTGSPYCRAHDAPPFQRRTSRRLPVSSWK